MKSITEIEAADLAQLQTLLRDNGLPDDDCAEQAGHFVGIYQDRRLIAAGGLQPADEYGLLRSLVVDPAFRARGLGGRICDFLLQRGATQRLRALYLLTENSQAYFASRGFTEIPRAQVPPAVAATRQFDALCPQSATCMARYLD